MKQMLHSNRGPARLIGATMQAALYIATGILSAGALVLLGFALTSIWMQP
jgi:hypothetical protein